MKKSGVFIYITFYLSITCVFISVRRQADFALIITFSYIST
ncbi:hypothetical protein D083_4124 [Dickeya solani RNS 08.23.3.1.A]|nr:hypothetical protein D083_4124 [Dickeya solani RNS 08.23.3.1.A]